MQPEYPVLEVNLTVDTRIWTRDFYEAIYVISELIGEKHPYNLSSSFPVLFQNSSYYF